MKRSPLRYAVWVLLVVMGFLAMDMLWSILLGIDIYGLSILFFVIAGLFATIFSRIASQEENDGN